MRQEKQLEGSEVGEVGNEPGEMVAFEAENPEFSQASEELKGAVKIMVFENQTADPVANA